jgi:release factor glutamine methyltransferase
MVDDIFKRGIKAKRIIDICSGSGCIALALKKHFPDAEVMALDISEDAIRIAEENAKINHLKIDFVNADILDLKRDLGMVDLIVSNPPYVMEKEKQEMKPNVLNYEPALALFVSDEDALVFYRSIISYAVEKLNKGGWLFMEINEKFGKEIKEMMKAAGINKNLEINVDLNSKDRWLSGQKSE